jgi:hypothetical protein
MPILTEMYSVHIATHNSFDFILILTSHLHLGISSGAEHPVIPLTYSEGRKQIVFHKVFGDNMTT